MNLTPPIINSKYSSIIAEEVNNAFLEVFDYGMVHDVALGCLRAAHL